MSRQAFFLLVALFCTLKCSTRARARESVLACHLVTPLLGRPAIQPAWISLYFLLFVTQTASERETGVVSETSFEPEADCEGMRPRGRWVRLERSA